MFKMPITYLSKNDLVKQLCTILEMEFGLTGNSYQELHTVVKKPAWKQQANYIRNYWKLHVVK